jgi:hypothetical protein
MRRCKGETMTARGAPLTALVFVIVATVMSSALADPLPAHSMFWDMFFKGCMPAIVKGTAIEAYARGAQMSAAPAEWTALFLENDPGKVYMRPDPYNPMFIVEYSAAGSCSVAARSPPDLPGLVAVMERTLLASDSPFKRFTPEKSRATTNTELWLEYQGKIDGRNFGVMLTTNSAKDAPTQAMVQVYKW